MNRFLLSAILLSGCLNEHTGNPTTDKRHRIENAVLQETFTAAFKIGIAAGASELSGEGTQDIASAIFKQSSQIDGAAALQHIIRAAAGPGNAQTAAAVASVAVAQYAKAAPQTSTARKIVVDTIAAGLQKAAAEVIYSETQP